MRILLSLHSRVNYPIPHTLHQHFPEIYLIKNQKYQLAGISPEDLTETCHSFGQKKHPCLPAGTSGDKYYENLHSVAFASSSAVLGPLLRISAIPSLAATKKAWVFLYP